MSTSTRTRTSQRANGSDRPLLTPSGALLLSERVADIRQRRLAELVPLLVEHERDERHVAEFEHLLAQADRWDALLNSADILQINPAAFDGRVELGMRVQVRLVDGSSAWVRPVHPLEAFLDDERISVTSPLGAALNGAHLGDGVFVYAPVGKWTCRILAVDFGDGDVRKAPRRRRLRTGS
jgi:transcription elongation GreA/GreB family factor